MTPAESRQIELLRVFCIVAMIWVHVTPGLSVASAVSVGSYSFVGAILGDTLGRISLTTLSFVSGYLFWSHGAGRPTVELFRQRLRGILAPMLIWSAIFIALAICKEAVTGVPSEQLGRIAQTPFGWVNAWSGLAGPTVNLSLFFLRDLFVCALILRLLAPLIRSFPAAVTIAVAALTVFQLTEPIVFRPVILLFMVLGAVVARRGVGLTTLSHPVLSLGLGYALTVAGFALAQTDWATQAPVQEAAGILRRLGIGFFTLAFSAAMLRLGGGRHLAGLGRHSYLAYLMHVPLVGIFWALWTYAGGDATDTSYIGFFLAAPFVVYVAAVWLGRIIDGWPQGVQIALRGRVVAPTAPRVARVLPD